MKLKLESLRGEAERFVEAGEPLLAVRLYVAILRRVPQDFVTRLRLADALVSVGARREAHEVYRATGNLCLNGGWPLVAIVACRAMEQLGFNCGALLSRLSNIYGRGSAWLGDIGGRLNVVHEGLTVPAAELRRACTAQELVQQARVVGSCTGGVAELPMRFPRDPVLSALSPRVLLRAVEATVVHRLPAGHVVIQEGDEGRSCFFIATGRVAVSARDELGEHRTLAPLGPGALFGEMALVSGTPRSATVMTTESTDLVEVGPAALAAIGEELDALVEPLRKLARVRWMDKLLTLSPVFRVFDAEQKQTLLQHVSVHKVPAGTLLFREGESARGIYLVYKGAVDVTHEHHEGPPSRLRTVRAGAMVGARSALYNRPASATAMATEDSTLFFLPGSRVRRLSAAVPEFVEAVDQVNQHRSRSYAIH